MEQTLNEFIAWVKENLPTIKSNNYLDVGCNDGWKMEEWGKHGYDVQGIDIDESKVKIVKDKNMPVSTMDMHDITNKESYAAVFCLHVLEKSTDINKAVSSMFDSLHIGGRLYIATKDSLADDLRFAINTMHHTRIVKEEFREENKSAYWVIVEKRNE